MSSVTTINRVSIRCPAGVEHLQARLRVSYLLSTAEYRPVGLPPQAILMVRRLSAPNPLNLQGIRVPSIWETQLQNLMAAYYRRAARPGDGSLNADAVIFEDRAELLAFLGMQVVNPEPDVLWIWRSAAGSGAAFPGPEAFARLCSETARFVPAALQILAQKRVLFPLLTQLTARQAETLLAAVAWEFGMSLTVQDVDEPAGLLKPGEISIESVSTASGPDPSTSAPVGFAPAPQRDGGRTGEALPLGISTLSNWPTAELSALSTLTAPARKLVLLCRAIEESPTASQAAALYRETMLHLYWPISIPAMEAAEEQVRFVPGEKSAAPPAEEAYAKHLNLQQAVSQTDTAARSSTDGPLPVAHEAEINAPTESSKSEPRIIDEFYDTDVSEYEIITKPWAGLDGAVTRLGGAFYLIGFLIQQESPACFEPEYPVSFWGLLEQFVGYLVSLSQGDYGADPLWRILARLDHRDHTLAMDPAISSQITAICMRLEHALAAAIGAESILPMLETPATVYMTRVHLDVVFSIDRIFMPARLSGLDRNPGWIPELTRVVSVHFE